MDIASDFSWRKGTTLADAAIDETQWVKAIVALDRMTADGENPASAMETLASYLRLGKLRARAKAIWLSEEPSLPAAWKNKPEDGGTDTDIPVGYWRSHKNWANDAANWRWPGSRFHVTLRNKPVKRRMMLGIEFCLADLRKLQPRYFGDGKRVNRRGPAPDLGKRDRVWSELFAMAISGELTDPAKRDFETQSELQELLYQRINPAGRQPQAGQNIISEIVRQAYPRITP